MFLTLILLLVTYIQTQQYKSYRDLTTEEYVITLTIYLIVIINFYIIFSIHQE